MPYKNKLTGIYSIVTPNGNSYIGSSVNIYHRWAGHRGALRNRKHHSTRLQAAFDKHGDNLTYKILCLCSIDMMNFYEQLFIDGMGGELNTTKFVNNVWANPDTREKLEKHHKSELWKKQRSEIALRNTKRWVPVETSIGEIFESMSKAARAYKTTTQHIKHLIECQTLGRLGVRFKRLSDEWTEEKTQHQKAAESNKGRKHSIDAIKKMRAAKVGYRPDLSVGEKGNKKTAVKVIATSISNGEIIIFDSQRDAARYVKPDNHKTASAQICKACRGVKKSAYGYVWGYQA